MILDEARVNLFFTMRIYGGFKYPQSAYSSLNNLYKVN